jgi:hypothetical protein
MNTDRTDQDPAERKIDEWAEESRRNREEASATATMVDEPDSQPESRDEPVDERSSQGTERDDRAGGTATSTADLARAGAPAEHTEDAGEDDQPTALFAEDDASGYRTRWLEVQTEFVDDPRQAVQRADALVAELMQQLAETFASERSDLEQQWDRGGEVSTEDLRVSLRRYRSFFDRLLSL